MRGLAGLVLLSVPSVAFGQVGSGTLVDPYLVHDCVELAAIGAAPAAHYAIATNIDCAVGPYASGFPAITSTSPNDGGTPFSGSLDGQGYTIRNLTASPTFASGLFGYIDGGDVSNLIIRDSSISSGTFLGGFIAGNIVGSTANPSNIDNVAVLGVNNATYAGGLFGQARRDVHIDFVYVDVDNTSTAVNGFVGGIAATAFGDVAGPSTVTRSWTRGTAHGHDAGGFVGRLLDGEWTFSGCLSEVDVSIVSPGNIQAAGGGFVGRVFDDITILNSYSLGTVTGVGNRQEVKATVGLAANGTVTVENSYALEVVEVGNGSNFGSVTLVDSVVVTAADETAGTYNVSTAPPLDQWDFVSIWLSDGVSLPVLRDLPSPPPDGPDCVVGQPFDWDNDGVDDGCKGTVAVFIDPSVTVPPGTQMGDNVMVARDVTFGTGNVIYDGGVFGVGATIGNDNTLLDDSFIDRGATIGSNNTLDATIVGRNADVGDSNSFGFGSQIGYLGFVGDNVTVSGSVVVGNGARLGTNGAASGAIDCAGPIVIGGSARIADTGAGTLTCGGTLIVGPNSVMGPGAVVGDNLRIRKDATIGSSFTAGTDVTVGRGVQIGDNVSLLSNTNVGAVSELCDTATPFSGRIRRGTIDPTCP